MKRYSIYLLAAVVGFSAPGCYSDDTNLDYKTLDLPRIENPDKDPALFIENHVYEFPVTEPLVIKPNVVYSDPSDLSYKWVINGEVVSTEKDLEWTWDSEESRLPGYFEIRRNSAGNSQILSFTVKLLTPFASGFSMLVEQDGALRYDFIERTVASPQYEFTYHTDASGQRFAYSGSNPRLEEYWSCESGNTVLGKQLFLDSDPNNCVSLDGTSLLPEMTLQEEFINETFPADFRVKDFMHGGFVSYLLSDDGRIFSRRGLRIFYTGRFMDLPLQYQGKQVHGERFITPKYDQGYGLIYETTEQGGRFLLVNFDYNSGTDYTPTKAGELLEFDPECAMSGITDYELVDGWFVLNKDISTPVSSVLLLFRGKTDGKYYLREVAIEFTSRTSAIDFEEVFPEVYRELPDFGTDSRICVYRVDGTNYIMPYKTDYVFYTQGSDPRTVLVRERKGTGASSVFHTFDQEVVAIVEGPTKRTNCYLLFALADGTVMVYEPLNTSTGAANFTTFEPERVISTYEVDGTIRWVGYKYGSFGDFS